MRGDGKGYYPCSDRGHLASALFKKQAEPEGIVVEGDRASSTNTG